MSSLPKISIITPSYNQGQYIEECILSVKNQNYENAEHIIIDGGSTDNTVDIIKKYAEHITYWVSEKDGGQSEAINKGMKLATGDIVTWLNSDDAYLPNTLTRVVDLFEKNPNTKLIHGNSILFGMGKKERFTQSVSKNLQEKYLAFIPFPQPSSFFKKEILNTIGMLDESLHYGMDYDLLVRIALNYSILQTKEVFSKYRIHAESKTVQGLNFAKEWSIIYSKLLRSVPNTSAESDIMEKAGLYNKGKDKYDVSKYPDNIKLSTLYFLNTQMHYYYDALDLSKTAELAELIKEFDPEFYFQERVNQVFKKSKYLNPSLINLLRHFTRK